MLFFFKSWEIVSTLLFQDVLLYIYWVDLSIYLFWLFKTGFLYLTALAVLKLTL